VSATKNNQSNDFLRSRRGIGYYLPDFILGATDGVITTLAIVSGVVGASLSTTVVLILGFANIVADGISMGASNILSRRSSSGPEALPSLRIAGRHGLATFVGFVAAGIMPLVAYMLPGLAFDRFWFAAGLGLLTLFLVGAGRAFFTTRRWLPAGLEMLVLGAVAAAAAYGVGAIGSSLIRVD
jgi:VIT1/CCC1 family predicted Fe2+/Mn2+ transporter